MVLYFIFDNSEMAESSIAQMSFQSQVCERWIGSLNVDSQGTEVVDDSWMGISSTMSDYHRPSIAVSGGGVCGKRVADSPLQEDGPSKRRKAVRDMSECLLNSISVRAAHGINMALAPGVEPLLRGQSNLVFPRFSKSSKSPHYDLPAESRSARRGERRVLFPFTGGASLNPGLAGAVDLKEPLFEDFSQDSDCLQFTNGMHHHSVGEKISKPVYDVNNNVVDPNNWDGFSCGIAGCNPKNKYEDLLEFLNYASTQDFSCHESANERLGTDLLKREPKPCPTSAFQLFTFKVLPLLRMPEEEAIDAVKSSWDRLPTTEKYAFEMQKFALKDSYKNELLTFVDTMPEATRKIYLSLRRRTHAKFFGFDIYIGYGGEGANGDARQKMDVSSNGQLKWPHNLGTYRDSIHNYDNNGSLVSDHNGHTELGNTNFNNYGRLYSPLNFEASVSAAQTSSQKLQEHFNTSSDHHADERNNACTSLSDPATSFSSASWHTDEEPIAFEELSFVEEDVTQEFDSETDCDCSQTSTVTSVVMRPVRN